MQSTTKALFVSIVLAGCGGGGGSPIDDFGESEGTAEEMQFWADGASAAALFYQAYTPMFVAGFAGMEATCPVIVEGPNGTTYDGGCTDDDGNEWFGHAEATGMEGATTGNVVYESFGFTGDSDDCPGERSTTTWDGSMEMTVSGQTIDFTIGMEVTGEGVDDDCQPLDDAIAISYQGTMVQQGEDANVFSGSGEVGSRSRGAVDAETDAEVVDSNICDSEALSGTTTIRASGHTAVITYDGQTDCEETSTVTWTYDGADQGELEGVSCRTGRGGRAGMVLVVLAVFLSVLRTRRRVEP
jgi:hypothetical protein